VLRLNPKMNLIFLDGADDGYLSVGFGGIDSNAGQTVNLHNRMTFLPTNLDLCHCFSFPLYRFKCCKSDSTVQNRAPPTKVDEETAPAQDTVTEAASEEKVVEEPKVVELEPFLEEPKVEEPEPVVEEPKVEEEETEIKDEDSAEKEAAESSYKCCGAF